MESSILNRLLTPAFLTEKIARNKEIGGAVLLSATPSDIDAPGYLSDLVGVTLEWSAGNGGPTRAVLKVSHPGFGQPELPFYEGIAIHLRQRFEMPLLDRYHAALAASGVAGYSRERLQEDYRLAVLLHLRTPLARFERRMSAFVWWPQLMRVGQAVQDLRCLDLLRAP